MQAPTGYTGIYANWNVDVDNADTDDNITTGGDNPWHFGTASQYPILQYGRDAVAIQRLRSPSAAAVDYDANNNNLIDVNNLAQLDAIRYDGNGDGIPVRGAGAVSYLAAFPGLTRQMGCPNACAGYELGGSLDFDTAGNDDRADAPYANWMPLGTYTSTFRGNAHTISNLNVSSAAASARLGLFAELGSGGRITAVGLINSTVSGTGARRNPARWRAGTGA